MKFYRLFLCLVTFVSLVSVLIFVVNDVETEELLEDTMVNVESQIPEVEQVPEEIIPEKEYINYLATDGRYELPIQGATGYASVSLSLREEPSTSAEKLATLIPGDGFQILEEDGEWWKVIANTKIGYVLHKTCFINLPDLIPSIIYNDSNADASVFRASGKEIPNITNQQLYQAYGYNPRLEEHTYVMPCLYSMATKINQTQQNALADGNTIVLYEAFRPYETQMKVVNSMLDLIKVDTDVYNGVASSPWSVDWFIATGVSNHQEGYAIDISLGKVLDSEYKNVGDYTYLDVTEYTEYTMPTPIHELSNKSISMSYPVAMRSTTAWQTAEVAKSMNAEAILLQKYCTDAMLTPLASEWWHFNDLASAPSGNGNYFVNTNFSIPPTTFEDSLDDTEVQDETVVDEVIE